MQDSHNGREEGESLSRTDPYDATGGLPSERGAAEHGVDTADPPTGRPGVGPSTREGRTDGDSTPGPNGANPGGGTHQGPPTGPAPLHRHVIKPDLRQEEHIKGSHPGDRYVRFGRNVGAFRRKSGGVLAASLETDRPRNRFGRVFNRVKRVLIGVPLSTEQSIHERLTNVKALAVLSSDALSSVAYATEEILRILIVAGAGAFSLALPLGGAIIVLLAIVVTSYRQTIAAYPRGGGPYIVAKDNHVTLPGLAASSSILIDYVLTVADDATSRESALTCLLPTG